jgi:hypothetical protein
MYAPTHEHARAHAYKHTRSCVRARSHARAHSHRQLHSRSLAQAKIVDCPRPGCGESLLLEAKDIGKKNLRCAKCDTQVCSQCGAVAAQGHRCVTLHLSAEEKKQMKKLKLRMCPSCGNGVQKSIGCMSMVCRCSAKFCYTCGQEWKGASRCSCPGMH